MVVLTGTDRHSGITEDGVDSGVTLGADREEDLGAVRGVVAGARGTVLGASIAMIITKGVSENRSATVGGVGEISVISSGTNLRIEETVLGVPSRRKTRKLSLTRQMYVCAY